MLFTYFLIPLFFTSSWCLLPDDDDGSSCYQKCFHQPAEACPKQEERCRCMLMPNCRKAAICCNVSRSTLNEGLSCGKITSGSGPMSVEALHIRNATLDVFNLSSFVSAWKKLSVLTVTDGQIESVVGEFSKITGISCLNLSSNGIHKLEPRSLNNLFNLSYLDLSNNNLTDVPRFKKEGAVTLDISKNPSMLCSSVKDTLSRSEVIFHNENSTECSLSQKFAWFDSTEHIAISQVRLLHELEKNCLGNCTCKPYQLDIIIGKPPTFSVEVNCSGAHLQSLPTPLPPFTIHLDVSNNNITSLKELSDPSYQYLRYLYADNNQISSIQHLEGTKFYNSFTTLSLRNNKIKTFETYLLWNIKFYRISSSTRHMNLGFNNLHCDCKTAMEFKTWLLTKIENIPDYESIGCENMPVKVIKLDQSKLCQGKQDWTDYIYYIITAEVLLLIGLIAKVSYDYWVFKTAGYLPWPASKMPKLPCDWLCE